MYLFKYHKYQCNMSSTTRRVVGISAVSTFFRHKECINKVVTFVAFEAFIACEKD